MVGCPDGMFKLLGAGRATDSTSLGLLKHVQSVQEKEREHEREAFKMVQEAESLRQQAEALTQPWDRVAAVTMKRRAQELDERARKRRMTVEDTMKVMKEFEREREMQDTQNTHTSQQQQERSRMMLANKYESRLGLVPSHTLHIENDVCNKCGVNLLLIDGETILKCPQCHQERQFNNMSSSAVPYQEVGGALPRSANGYNRFKKITSVLSMLQAKETVLIDEGIIEMLKGKVGEGANAESVKSAITKYCTPKDATFLKKHVPMVLYRITGVEPPRLTEAQEKVILRKFTTVMDNFDDHVRKAGGSARHKFLDFVFLIRELCRDAGYMHMVSDVEEGNSNDRRFALWQSIKG